MNPRTLPATPIHDHLTEPEASPDTGPVKQRARRSLAAFLLGQRHRFILDRRSQFRAAGLVTVTVLLLLVMVNVALHMSRMESTAAVVAYVPGLQSMLQEQDNLELALIATASAIFLLAVFVVTILETHRTAGAAFRLARGLRELREGNYGVCTILRKGDNLGKLEQELNDLSRVLYERAGRTVAELERVADRAGQVSNPPEARALSERLQELAGHERARMV